MADSTDVLAMLRRHYLPEGRPAAGLFAPEIGSPDGRRRADLLWVPTSRTGAHSDNIIGHEIKVSRADVLNELADPTKADPWAQFCTRWWLVIPDPTLISGLEIPEMWGVYAPPSGRRTRSMTVVKPAPKLTPTADLAPALTRITAFVVNRVETKVNELEREKKWRDRTIEQQNRTIDQLRMSGAGGAVSPHASRLNGILSEVRNRTQRGGWWLPEVTDEEIIAALVDHAAVKDAAERARHDVDRLLKSLEDPLAWAREALTRAAETAGHTTGSARRKAG